MRKWHGRGKRKNKSIDLNSMSKKQRKQYRQDVHKSKGYETLLNLPMLVMKFTSTARLPVPGHFYSCVVSKYLLRENEISFLLL